MGIFGKMKCSGSTIDRVKGRVEGEYQEIMLDLGLIILTSWKIKRNNDSSSYLDASAVDFYSRVFIHLIKATSKPSLIEIF